MPEDNGVLLPVTFMRSLVLRINFSYEPCMKGCYGSNWCRLEFSFRRRYRLAPWKS